MRAHIGTLWLPSSSRLVVKRKVGGLSSVIIELIANQGLISVGYGKNHIWFQIKKSCFQLIILHHKGFHNSLVVSQNPKPTLPHEAHIIIIIIIIGPNDNYGSV
jgi:hypothetical protein